MTWEQIREAHPNQWVVFEALAAHDEDGRWCVDLMQPVGAFDDFSKVWERYQLFHQLDRSRDYGFYHTSNEELEIGIIDAFGRIQS
ncbi:MAG: hypothetical protein AAFV33_06365 [Chloroflexota bacterium]